MIVPAEQSCPRVPCSNTREVGRRLLGFGIQSVEAHALADLFFWDHVHLQNYPSRPTNIPLARNLNSGTNPVNTGSTASHGGLSTSRITLPISVCNMFDWDDSPPMGF